MIMPKELWMGDVLPGETYPFPGEIIPPCCRKGILRAVTASDEKSLGFLAIFCNWWIVWAVTFFFNDFGDCVVFFIIGF